jgi:4-hydroxy-tetrahydrodipicolinate reductase
MGQTVCEAVAGEPDLELAGRADPALGTSVEEAIRDAAPEVVVDFTTPESVLANAKLCLGEGVHVVVGTTGITADGLEELGALAASSSANCIVAPNFAIGAVLMMEAAKMIAPHMPECEIVELHHSGKLDAPSGTAKRTAELIEKAGGRPHEPIHSVRLPGLVAHQEIVFGGLGQTLTVRHDSLARESFMPGVLLAIRAVAGIDGLVVGLEKLLDYGERATP